MVLVLMVLLVMLVVLVVLVFTFTIGVKTSSSLEVQGSNVRLNIDTPTTSPGDRYGADCKKP